MHRNQRKYRFVLLCLILGGLLLLNGCGDDDPEPVKPTFNSLWKHLFADCSVACHNTNATSDGTDKGPDLAVKDQFLDQLVDKSSAVHYPDWIRSGTCSTVPMISPGDAANSTVAGSLIESVSNTLMANNGDCITSYNFHAQLQTVITDQDVADALVEWINAGAMEN